MARVFITGSTDGLGLAAARNLLRPGHQVVLHARSQGRAKEAGEVASQALATVYGDLSSASEVKSIADQVNALGRMDAIIHNAGIYTVPDRGCTPEGHPTVLAVNTLAPYILTALIERPGRLVYLSSNLHRGGQGSLDDLEWTKRSWDGRKAYAESKLHVAALAAAVARRWPDVLSNAVDPGWVRTRMGGSSAPVEIDTGQRTQSWLAVSDDERALMTGRYWRDMQLEQPVSEISNPTFQKLLISSLEEITGVVLPL